MSYDLFVVRDRPPISAEDVFAAIERVTRTYDCVSFFRYRLDRPHVEAFFWRVGRAYVDLVPPPHELDDSGPYVQITGPTHPRETWLAFLALAFAKELDGRIYDPQGGEYCDVTDYEDAGRGELGPLREAHEELLREYDPQLVIKYSARVPVTSRDVSRALLEAFVKVLKAMPNVSVAKPSDLVLGEKQLNWWITVTLPSGPVVDMSSQHGETSRSVSVKGAESDRSELDAFAAEIASRLGVTFRELVEFDIGSARARRAAAMGGRAV
jgi:hypothetical protein